ncbi:hypothetical protein NL676_032374 [Syzygium grande]|nr:hypothetical protein NL676_032374 [Syzygium grande]
MASSVSGICSSSPPLEPKTSAAKFYKSRSGAPLLELPSTFISTLDSRCYKLLVDPPMLIALPLQDPAVDDAGVQVPAAHVEGEALGLESSGDRNHLGSVEAVAGSQDGRRVEEMMGRQIQS